MYPVVFEFMIKERIKDLNAELEQARMIASAKKEAELKMKTKGGAGGKPGLRLWPFLSGKG